MARTRRKGAGEVPSEVITPQSVGDTTAAGLDRDRIAMRAYELYLSRGGSDGAALDDWLAAEREIAGRSGDKGSTE